MADSSVRTKPVRSGERRVSSERRTTRAAGAKTARTARRRWLILFAVVLVVVVGILANIGPLTHLQDARASLNKTTATVADLQAQKSQLQQQLAELNDTSYLETLARQELTYARPGEDLYIVTGTTGDVPGSTEVAGTGGGGSGIGAGMSGTPQAGSESGAAAPSAASGQTTGQGAGQAATQSAGQAGEKPGLLERALAAIQGLF